MLKKARVFPFSRALIFVFLVSFSALIFNPCPLHASSINPESQNLVPSVIVRLPADGPEHIILVDKSLQKLIVYKKDDLTQPFKTYTCSTGENDGPKERQNDRKTPEGIYFFIDALKKQHLASIYGAMAFPIDYPNPIDKREGRKGYGIWFHGTNKVLKPRDTNGCVAMEDRDIQDLAQYIALFKTPTIIGAQIEMVSPPTLQKEKEELEAVIEGWRTAWQNKDIEKYSSYYSRLFFDDSNEMASWKAYKARLADQYAFIRVDIDNLHIFQNNGLVMALFNQHYQTPTMRSFGEKRLFLKKNSEQWKIIGEYFQGPKKAEKEPVTPAAVNPPSVFDEVESFVYAWVDRWIAKDLTAYMACYDPGFRSRGMDLQAWQDHRAYLNRKFTNLKIEINRLQVSMLADNRALVVFEQRYQADDYVDNGRKKLLLIKKEKEWKIKSETWNP